MVRSVNAEPYFCRLRATPAPGGGTPAACGQLRRPWQMHGSGLITRIPTFAHKNPHHRAQKTPPWLHKKPHLGHKNPHLDHKNPHLASRKSLSAKGKMAAELLACLKEPACYAESYQEARQSPFPSGRAGATMAGSSCTGSAADSGVARCGNLCGPGGKDHRAVPGWTVRPASQPLPPVPRWGFLCKRGASRGNGHGSTKNLTFDRTGAAKRKCHGSHHGLASTFVPPGLLRTVVPIGFRM